MKVSFPYTGTILLGSKSPRRSQLMKEAGFTIEVKTLDVDEQYPEDTPIPEIAAFIAKKKADEYLSLLDHKQIGLTADTVVALEDQILEKPIDFDEAFEMLSQLSNMSHTVYTGVCIFNSKKTDVFTGASEVYFKPFSNREIEYYLLNYAPFDKAGSYGIQEWIGLTKIEKIVGSYSNIMGLPMELVYDHLYSFDQKV